MARVIVILALMLAFAAAMFAITRKSAIAPGEAASEASATVRLTAMPEAAKVEDAAPDAEAESLESAAPRTFSKEMKTASAQDVTDGPVAGAAPSFGTAGVDHKGNASFTGTATPGDAISLLANGKAIGSTKADGVGNWTLGFKTPKSNRVQEVLVSARGSDGSVVIGPQRAIIIPPAKRGGLPGITLKAADQPATAPQEGNVAPPEAKTGLVVEKVSPGDGGLTLLNGKADPGATIKVAINGEAGGETLVAPDGTWSLAATNVSGKAADSLRLELVDKGGASLDKTDVPYKVPVVAPKTQAGETKLKTDFSSVLSSKPEPRPKPAKSDDAQDTAALVAPATGALGEPPAAKVIKVRRGDSLWRISKRHLGKGKKWAAFYEANKAKIDNPDLIYPGQLLIIPA